MTDNFKSNAEYVFEVSWEVCNKVGGIYTVIKSKAVEMMLSCNNYYLIGPYFESSERIDFLRKDTPELFKDVFDELRNEGIICHYGVWEELKGKPETILIDFRNIIHQKNNIKGDYWNDFKIDSLRGYWDFEEPSLWSYAVGRLIEKVYNKHLQGKKVVAQFHEWLGAFGLMYLRKNCKNIATVFTTHATVLGRTIAGNGRDLYASIKSIDPLTEAYNHNVEAKHLTEKAGALNADIFTTVSEITAIEAEKFLGRKPEVIVPNGLDSDKFPSFEESSIQHSSSREVLREFLAYYFFPYYAFDVEHNLIFYTVGRFEYRNKGYDILIKALGRLNEIMRKERQESQRRNVEYSRTLCMFFWIPMEHHGIKLEVLENKNVYMNIKHFVNTHSPELLNRIIYDAISKKESTLQTLFTENFMREMKKEVLAFSRKGDPPLSTHNVDERNNMLFNALRENGLDNKEDDPVKVVVEPVYLDGNDGFLELTYYDAMVGCHLGLFPSYYEPWGYTPLESAALSVPCVTTDMSGFGMYLKSKGLADNGVYVLERMNRPEDQVIEEFAQILHNYSQTLHQERGEMKINARRTSLNVEWRVLIQNYIEAHNKALAIDASSKNLVKV